jgi:serine/threonine protein kinase
MKGFLRVFYDDDDSLLINSQMRSMYEKAIACLDDGSEFAEYKIVRLLGRGGMGAVYEARHVTLEEHFAIKVLPYEFMERKDALQRFENEARVMAKLKHPNIVKVDDFRRTQGLYWLRMELARGDGKNIVSLQELADANDGIVEQSLLLQLMDDVLRGLAYAHQKGVIHRDLKPANILLFPKSSGGFSAKVSDYGLVKMLGEEFLRSKVTQSVQLSMSGSIPQDGQRTSARALLGTWEYMSPEQQNGAGVSTQSDVYSMGLILYKLLTGKTLSPRSPSFLNKNIVPEWDNIVLTAMETETHDRYADANEMLKALEIVKRAIQVSDVSAQKKQLQSYIRENRVKAAEAVKKGDFNQALEILTKIAQTYPENKNIQQDIRKVNSIVSAHNKATTRYREVTRKTEMLVEGGHLDEALKLLMTLENEFGTRQIYQEKVSSVRKLIAKRNAERQQAKVTVNEQGSDIQKKTDRERTGRQQKPAVNKPTNPQQDTPVKISLENIQIQPLTAFFNSQIMCLIFGLSIPWAALITFPFVSGLNPGILIANSIILPVSAAIVIRKYLSGKKKE